MNVTFDVGISCIIVYFFICSQYLLVMVKRFSKTYEKILIHFFLDEWLSAQVASDKISVAIRNRIKECFED